MKTFSFVIPCFNKYHLLHQTLLDIYKNCSPVEEVVVADNGSSDVDFHDGLNWWKKNGMLPIRHLRIEENVGFLRASNIGMKKAVGDVVCLLSNDVRIYKDVVKSFMDQLSTNPRSLVGGRLLDWDTGWNCFDGKIFPYVEGWLLCTTQDAWKELNYFDMRYAPYDAEDLDLSTTAKDLGYTLLTIPESYTYHLGAQSIGYSPEREEQTKKNIKKFEDKWVKKVKALSS